VTVTEVLTGARDFLNHGHDWFQGGSYPQTNLTGQPNGRFNADVTKPHWTPNRRSLESAMRFVGGHADSQFALRYLARAFDVETVDVGHVINFNDFANWDEVCELFEIAIEAVRERGL
jgi:hypothetical protein